MKTLRTLVLIITFFNLWVQPTSLVQAQTIEDKLVIDHLEPHEGEQGVWIHLTVIGTGFDEETRIYMRHEAYTVNPNIENVTPTSIDINFEVPFSDRLLGTYNVTAWNYDGDEFMLIDGFTAVKPETQPETQSELEVIIVDPYKIERGIYTWITLRGTGFVYEPSEISTEEPYKTYVLGPWLGVQNSGAEIYNSSFMRIQLNVYRDFPPQEVEIKIFNPSRDSDLSLTLDELYAEQNDPKQHDSFYVEIFIGKGDESLWIPGFPFYSIIIGISLFEFITRQLVNRNT